MTCILINDNIIVDKMLLRNEIDHVYNVCYYYKMFDILNNEMTRLTINDNDKNQAKKVIFYF